MIAKKIDKAKYYKFLIYLVALILINLVSMNLFYRFDLTAKKLYSLSDISKDVVSTLQEPLTINVFFSKNIPAPYNNIERYLHDLLESYSIHANRRFNYRFYNVTADEGALSEKAKENRELAQNYGIYPVNIQTVENDQAKVQRAYMGMVLIHGDVVENLNSLTSTDGLEYKITTTIRKMNKKISALLNLEEDITVRLLKSSSLESLQGTVDLKGIDTLEETLQEVVDDLNPKNYNKLKLKIVDPSNEPLAEEEGERFSRFLLRWDPIETRNGGTIPAGEGMIALGLQCGESRFQKNLLTKSVALSGQGLVEQFSVIEKEAIQDFISGNIDNLVQVNDDIGYVSSNGTLPLMPSLPPQMAMMQQQQSELKVFNESVSENYTIKQINLGEEEIPDTIDTLIIAGPTEPFTQWQLYQIDQFLMKGKSLAVFADPFKEVQRNQGMMNRGFQQPAYLPVNTGLEKLLTHYGVSLRRSYVMDENCYVNQDTRTGEMPIYYAPQILDRNINHDFDFLNNIKQMILIKAAPLDIRAERVKELGVSAASLVSTSRRAWEMKDRINLTPMFIRPPQAEDEFNRFSLAVLMEGAWESYFKDREIPSPPLPDEPEESADEETPQEKGGTEEPREVTKSGLQETAPALLQGSNGRVFLLGSTEFLKNNVLINKDFVNTIFLLNTLDYLNNREGLAVLRAKNQTFNPLKESSLFTRRLAQYFNVAGLPLLVILIGIFVWIKRANRQRLIRKKFTDRAKPDSRRE